MLVFNTETREIVFLKDYWRADVDGMEKEGEIYAQKVFRISRLLERGTCPPSHDPNTYTEKRGVGMLVEGYGSPQPI
jgi:hypothetical protein